MALATGADTYKMKYGHRGGNHPVKHPLAAKDLAILSFAPRSNSATFNPLPVNSRTMLGFFSRIPLSYASFSNWELPDTDITIFAICLGHQLMALATGGDTYKMKYGHRGGNHPVKDLETGRVYISSQNHRLS